MNNPRLVPYKIPENLVTETEETKEKLAKASELTKEELLKLNKGKTKASPNAKPEPFNSASLHPCMSYDEKTGSFYIDHSKL